METQLIEKLKELINKQDIIISYFRKYSGDSERITRFIAEIGITKTELAALESQDRERTAEDYVKCPCCSEWVKIPTHSAPESKDSQYFRKVVIKSEADL